MTVPVVERGRLGTLSELGEGAEGRVFRTSAFPDAAYKEFLATVAHELDRDGLERTIELPNRFSADERSAVMLRTTWPHTVVVDHNGRLTGFLMPILPPDVFCRHGLKPDPPTVDCKWDLLMYRSRTQQNPLLSSPASIVEDDHLLSLLIDLARLVEILHRHDIVIGDISGRNLLWTPSPPGRVVMIDCDGMHAIGASGVTRPKQSPDWEDPRHGTNAVIESDEYKLALALYRAYFSTALAVPHPKSPPIRTPPEAERFVQMAFDAVGAGPRPTARDWSTCFNEMLRRRQRGGRPEIVLEAVQPQPPRVPPTPEQRPILRLK